eukprot:gene4807-103_t
MVPSIFSVLVLVILLLQTQPCVSLDFPPSCKQVDITNEEECNAACLKEGYGKGGFDDKLEYIMCFCQTEPGVFDVLCMPGFDDDDDDGNCHRNCLQTCSFDSTCADGLRCIGQKNNHQECNDFMDGCVQSCINNLDSDDEFHEVHDPIFCASACEPRAPRCLSVCNLLEDACEFDENCNAVLSCAEEIIANECFEMGDFCSHAKILDLIEQPCLENQEEIVVEHVISIFNCTHTCTLSRPSTVTTTTTSPASQQTPDPSVFRCVQGCIQDEGCSNNNECGSAYKCAVVQFAAGNCDDIPSCTVLCTKDGDATLAENTAVCAAECDSLPSTCTGHCLVLDSMCMQDDSCSTMTSCVVNKMKEMNCFSDCDIMGDDFRECETSNPGSSLQDFLNSKRCNEKCSGPGGSDDDSDVPCGTQCITDISCTLDTTCGNAIECMAHGVLQDACQDFESCQQLCVGPEEQFDLFGLRVCTEECPFAIDGCPYLCGLLRDVCFAQAKCRKAILCIETLIASGNANDPFDTAHDCTDDVSTLTIISDLIHCQMEERCLETTNSTLPSTGAAPICVQTCLEKFNCSLDSVCGDISTCVVDQAGEHLCFDYPTCGTQCNADKMDDFENLISCFYLCGDGTASGPYCIMCAVEAAMCFENSECSFAYGCLMTSCSGDSCSFGSQEFQECTSKVSPRVQAALTALLAPATANTAAVSTGSVSEFSSTTSSQSTTSIEEMARIRSSLRFAQVNRQVIESERDNIVAIIKTIIGVEKLQHAIEEEGNQVVFSYTVEVANERVEEVLEKIRKMNDDLDDLLNRIRQGMSDSDRGHELDGATIYGTDPQRSGRQTYNSSEKNSTAAVSTGAMVGIVLAAVVVLVVIGVIVSRRSTASVIVRRFVLSFVIWAGAFGYDHINNFGDHFDR